jgi:hypothetical protein
MRYTANLETIEIAVVIIAFFIVVPMMFSALPKREDIVKIDCTLSEISPDFTNHMREACREHRSTNNLQKSK